MGTPIVVGDRLTGSVPPHQIEGYGLAFPRVYPKDVADAMRHIFVGGGWRGAADKKGHGRAPESPFETIAFAATQIDSGTMVHVHQEHAEDIEAADAIAWAAGGIYLGGGGWNGIKPTLTFKTATAASMVLDQAGIIFDNFLFVSGIDALAAPIQLTAADCALLDCEWRDATDLETVTPIRVGLVAHRAMLDGLIIHGNVGQNNGSSGVLLLGADRTTIRRFWVRGDFAAGCLLNTTAGASNVHIENGYIRTDAPEDLALIMHANTTGEVVGPINVRLKDNAANIDQAVVLGKCNRYGSLLISNADGENGITWPGTDSTDA